MTTGTLHGNGGYTGKSQKFLSVSEDTENKPDYLEDMPDYYSEWGGTIGMTDSDAIR